MSDRPIVIVAVSASPSGQAALCSGLREARRRGARLHLIRVWRDIDRFYPMTGAEAATLRGQERAEQTILADAVKRAKQLDPALEVSAELVPGDLCSAIAAVAENAQFLVVGAGRSASGSASIGQWFERHSPCPVLIADAPVMVGREWVTR
jgi:nucleotide-binding universal stress UspA family protein